MIVVDASVAVKWFVPEKDSNKASDLLRREHKLLSPEIIRIEVAAALTRRLRTKELSEENTLLLLRDWHDHLALQAISLQATIQDFEAATMLSIQLGHQLQDCLYLAVANRFDIPLITADVKFFNKAIEAGHVVNLLADQ